MPQLKGQEEWTDFATEIATRPSQFRMELSPFDPTASPPPAAPIPEGARVVLVERDAFGRMVKKVTVDDPAPTLGGFVLPAVVLSAVLGWLGHRFLSRSPQG